MAPKRSRMTRVFSEKLCDIEKVLAVCADRAETAFNAAKAEVQELSNCLKEFRHDVNDGSADESDSREFTEPILAKAKRIGEILDHGITTVVIKHGVDENYANEFGEQLLVDYYDHLESMLSAEEDANAAEAFRLYYEECTEKYNEVCDLIRDEVEDEEPEPPPSHIPWSDLTESQKTLVHDAIKARHSSLDGFIDAAYAVKCGGLHPSHFAYDLVK